MKRSVGLIVMVKMPNGQLMAVLQRRGTFNHEKMALESFPGCLQVTCHGGLQDGENVVKGLVREVNEELGQDFNDHFSFFGTELLSEVGDDKKRVTTYGTILPMELIRDHLRLGPDTGGLVYVPKDMIDQIIEIRPEFKLLGPEFSRTLAMFPDEIAAVKKAFEIFGEM